MTPSTLSANPRIELARTRRMLEDTALAAVPGSLISLKADGASDHRWIAQVRSTSGEYQSLLLDRLLQTVEVAPAQAVAHAA